MTFTRICVFCGARSGDSITFAEAAQALGKEFLKENIGLVYGGGTVGLMGELARTIHNGGGEVNGVIPAALAPVEISGESIGTVTVVNDMHTRKAKMAELSEAFIALPGGFGTLEELFEVITWAQLGIHKKPIGCLNISGYFDPLKSLIANIIDRKFAGEESRELVIIEDDPAVLVAKLQTHKIPTSNITWITPEES